VTRASDPGPAPTLDASYLALDHAGLL